MRTAALSVLLALAVTGLPGIAAESTSPSRVRVVAAVASLEPRARALARRAPALVDLAARRLHLPAPPEIEVVVALAVPPADGRQPAWLVPPAPWVGGWADSAGGRIVLYADRAPRYPHEGLEGLLVHEAAHLVLAANLPPGARVPRWYDEGLAMLAERGLTWRDTVTLVRVELLAEPIPLEQLERSWPASGGRAAAAYAQSLSLLSWLERSAPPAAPRRLVEGLRDGLPFERAFAAAWGRSPAAAWQAWRRGVRWRYRIVPVLVAAGLSPGLIGVLALVASAVARRRRARRWAEFADGEGDEPPAGRGPRMSA
ncbi:MAG: hypothetical protein Kow0062_27490 [Acidobacteriota bacterium]